MSLKGYEFEINEAHSSAIRFLTFIPNTGILVSIDDNNVIRQWNLKNLGEPPREA